MTTRQGIKRYHRRVIGFWLGALACGGLVALLAEAPKFPELFEPFRGGALMVLLVTAIGMMFAHWVSLFIGGRCLTCRERVANVALSQWRAPKRVKYCPFCGASIDLEFPAERAPTK